MKGKLLAALAVGAMLLVVFALGLRYWMMQPLYLPGMVRIEQGLLAPLTPPAQSGAPDAWDVESNIRLHHFEQGVGPRILVIHGGPGVPVRRPWQALASLTEKYSFTFYDQRGCGRSSRPVQTFAGGSFWSNAKSVEKTLGLGAQVADIERIRRILGEDKLTIVGHSFGALLATLYAVEFPENVQALVLLAPADVLTMPSSHGGLYENVRSLIPQAMAAEYDDYLRRYFDFHGIFEKSDRELSAANGEFARFYRAAAVAHGMPLGPLAAVNAPDLESEVGGWMVQAMYFSMGQRHDYKPMLGRIASPTLVMHGERDLQDPSIAEEYVAGIKGATLHVVPGGGHFLFDDPQTDFASTLAAFLERHGPTPKPHL